MFTFRNLVLILMLPVLGLNLNAQTGGEKIQVRLKAALETGKPEGWKFSEKGGEIKVTLKDKVQVWDAETGKLLRIEEKQNVTPQPPNADFIWFGWGRKFRVFRLKKAKGETENRVVIWDREKNEILGELKGFSQKIARAVWSGDESRLLTVGEPKKPSFFSLSNAAPPTELIVWDTASARLQTRLILENLSEFSEPLLSSDGRKIVTRQTAPERGKISTKIWEAETGKLLYELVVPTRKTADGKEIDVSKAAISNLKFTSDGRFLIGTTADAAYPNQNDGNLIAWNAENGEVVWQTPDVSADSERYLGFKFSPDEKILVAVKQVTLSILKGKEEKTGEIRDTATGKLLVTLKNPEPDKREIAFYGGFETGSNLVFSPSAKTLITAGTSTAEVWDVATGERRCAFPRVWESATALFSDGLHTDDFRFRADEKIIVAGNDEYLRIWNAENCGLVQKIETPLAEAVWSGDDRFFLTLAKDKKTVQLWEVISN